MGRDGADPGRRGGSVDILLIAGLPGAGKTRLALALNERLGWLRLSRDDIRAGEFAAAGEAGKALAWGELLRRLDATLGAGRGAIVEGLPFSRRSELAAVAALAARHGAAYHLLWLDCPLPLAQSRVGHADSHDAPDRDAALVAAVAARFEPLPTEAFRLDAAQAFEAVLAAADAWLSRRLRRK